MPLLDAHEVVQSTLTKSPAISSFSTQNIGAEDTFEPVQLPDSGKEFNTLFSEPLSMDFAARNTFNYPCSANGLTGPMNNPQNMPSTYAAAVT
jgi:hypothetical protein